MAHKRLHLLTAAPLALALLAAPSAEAASKIHLESQTLLRWFQQERGNGDEKTGLPGYEYLRMDFGALEGDGLSGHLHGWGRYDFGDYFGDNAAGEVLYGYAQYAQAANNVVVRVGRQYLYSGVTTESLDGLMAAGDVTPYFTFSGFFGQPVALEETDGRSGDLLWGGRVSHRWKGLYDLGVSYKRADNDGEKEVESVGVDVSITPPWPVSIFGYSRRNLETDEWAEHSYEARLAWAGLLFRPFYQRFQYEDVLDNGVGTPKVFRDLLLAVGDEKLSIVGADASWRLASGFEVAAKAKHHDYSEADATSWYYGGAVTQHWSGATEVGAEVGRMDGDRDQDRYTLFRAHAYVDKIPLGKIPVFLSGDFVYAQYDEEILGEERSLFVSVGGGVSLLSDTLRLKLSGDYSADPYFDSDFRALAAVDFTFDK